MLPFILKRLLGIVPTLLVVATLVFVLVRLAPGGPFDGDRQVSAEVLRQIEAKYRLGDPVQGAIGADGHIGAAKVVIDRADEANDAQVGVLRGSFGADRPGVY